MAVRELDRILQSRSTREGAGVAVHRAFGLGTEQWTDPFLLLDEVHSQSPEEYSAGFPLHPHRGIDIVTYMLSGFLRQIDSLGKTCMIGPGCLQWLTTGSGVIHEEMPLESAVLRGFQLWINLPRAGKMVDPVYREATCEEIPVVPILGGKVRVLTGRFGGSSGPIIGIQGRPELLDVQLDSDAVFKSDIPSGRTAIVHVFEGYLDEIGTQKTEKSRELGGLLLGDGDSARLRAGSEGARFLLLTGTPLRQPIAWKGPVVMCDMSEVDLAYKEYSIGTFVKAL